MNKFKRTFIPSFTWSSRTPLLHCIPTIKITTNTYKNDYRTYLLSILGTNSNLAINIRW
ncbi:MAG: hypothetical protein IKF36_01420 [Bacilli bacterium]|nr:hypothetical protein [Bacilli bacterium]